MSIQWKHGLLRFWIVASVLWAASVWWFDIGGPYMFKILDTVYSADGVETTLLELTIRDLKDEFRLYEPFSPPIERRSQPPESTDRSSQPPNCLPVRPRGHSRIYISQNSSLGPLGRSDRQLRRWRSPTSLGG